MLRWIGLAMALAGGLMAILALWGGWGDYWVLVLIGFLFFVVGMGALMHLGRGNGNGGKSGSGGSGKGGSAGSGGSIDTGSGDGKGGSSEGQGGSGR